jgi:hypothetical protein
MPVTPPPGCVPGAAHVQAGDRAAVVAVAQHRARGPQLVERHVAVHDVASDEPELALEVDRRERHDADDRLLEAGREAVDGIDDQVGRRRAASSQDRPSGSA